MAAKVIRPASLSETGDVPRALRTIPPSAARGGEDEVSGGLCDVARRRTSWGENQEELAMALQGGLACAGQYGNRVVGVDHSPHRLPTSFFCRRPRPSIPHAHLHAQPQKRPCPHKSPSRPSTTSPKPDMVPTAAEVCVVLLPAFRIVDCVLDTGEASGELLGCKTTRAPSRDPRGAYAARGGRARRLAEVEVVREHGHEERNDSSKGTRPRSIFVDLDARGDPEPAAGGAAQVRAGVCEPMIPVLDAPHSLRIAHLPPGAEDASAFHPNIDRDINLACSWDSDSSLAQDAIFVFVPRLAEPSKSRVLKYSQVARGARETSSGNHQLPDSVPSRRLMICILPRLGPW
ncbi:hypothetical protein B0H14DRAFT_3744727 [Mycena olivaceomarginata]|nr:hypothetical protein B0H14DRAFT_3744727 [Mycena olivaceomarginata]